MNGSDQKADLHRYLKAGREALLWKLDGLSLIDGTSGLRAGNANVPAAERTWWEEYRERLERAAREADRA
jgi:hypothetical protein